MATHTASQTKELQDSALEHLWIYTREPSDMAEKGEPQIFVEGKGCKVTDSMGDTYIDCMSGWWLKNVGYGRTEIADAAYDQMLKITYMPDGSTTEPTIRLAEKVASITPGDLSRCFFSSGGSDAMETALKLARAYFKRVGEPTRTKFISRKGSYHGATFGAMSLGGHPGIPTKDYEPLLAGCFHAPQPNPYRCEYGGTTPEECAERCVKAIEDIIKFQGPDTVAAVVGEPVSTPMGAVVPGPNYWPLLREVCDRYGCLLIADEIINGFGRTGKMFACDHWGVTPDIMTVAKGITSGYIPMGAAVARKPIADAFVGSQRTALSHVVTFGGHPVASAAALKNIEIIEQDGLVENSARMGRYMLDGLEELKEKHQIIGDVRGLGLLCGVEFVRNRQTKEFFPAEAELGTRLTQGFHDNGLILRGGNGINPGPPLCVTAGEVDEIISAMDRAIGQVAHDLGAD